MGTAQGQQARAGATCDCSKASGRFSTSCTGQRQGRGSGRVTSSLDQRAARTDTLYRLCVLYSISEWPCIKYYFGRMVALIRIKRGHDNEDWN